MAYLIQKADNIIPMFQPKAIEKMTTQTNTEQKEISVFDVKELYDAAYAAKEYNAKNEATFQELMAKAVQMDLEYRRQLSQKSGARHLSQPKQDNASDTQEEETTQNVA